MAAERAAFTRESKTPEQGGQFRRARPARPERDALSKRLESRGCFERAKPASNSATCAGTWAPRSGMLQTTRGDRSTGRLTEHHTLDATGSGKYTSILFAAMKRIEATLFALVFVVGVLIAPAIHRAHCAEGHGSHDAAQCSICQLASTPVVATAPHIEPVAQVLVSARIYLPQSPIPSAPMSRMAQARGPPAA